MSDALAVPDRIAIDAKGYGWRVWDDQPDVVDGPDQPRQQPVTWFVPLGVYAELDAVTAAMCTNGADRLLELVGVENRKEAIACITGLVRAAVVSLRGVESTDKPPTHNEDPGSPQ